MNNCVIIHLIGDDSKVDTPLPIPNREVKHFNGENSVSEDSKLPIFFCLILLIFLMSFLIVVMIFYNNYNLLTYIDNDVSNLFINRVINIKKYLN